MARTLYIVGNGFDRHHGIPSDYSGFGSYLWAQDRITAKLVNEYLGIEEDLWSEFEERLAALDTDALVDDASPLCAPYGVEDWSDSGHHDFEYQIDLFVQALSSTLGGRFGEWVRQLPIPDPSSIRSVLLPLDPSATFLNFNYTPSIQRLYHVPDSGIKHIHGAAIDPSSTLILGHAWKPTNRDSLNYGLDPESSDPRVIAGNERIGRYFMETSKPTEQIIRDNRSFFEGLRDVEKIAIIGHSLTKVDRPYFLEVIRHIDLTKVSWKVSYHRDLETVRERVSELPVPNSRVEFRPLANF